jgi:hypothetical protein
MRTVRDLIAAYFVWSIFRPRPYRPKVTPPPVSTSADPGLGCLIVLLLIFGVPELLYIIHIIYQIIMLPSKIRW